MRLESLGRLPYTICFCFLVIIGFILLTVALKQDNNVTTATPAEVQEQSEDNQENQETKDTFYLDITD